MELWSVKETQRSEFGDRRLTNRLGLIVQTLTEHPNSSVPEAFGKWSQTKATYNFWSSEKVTPENIIYSHARSTHDRIKEHETVLVLSDTTSIDYSHHPDTEGLGYLETSKRRGIMMHSGLASTISGVPLGLLHQKQWIRPLEEYGKRHKRRKVSIFEKESRKWIDTMESVINQVPSSVQAIVVADRESDVYDVFAYPRSENVDFLIRATHNRRVAESEGLLIPAIEKSSVKGSMTITVRKSNSHKKRQATLEIKYQKLELLPPRNRKKTASDKPVSVTVILAEEKNPPKGIKAIRWLLITTLPVESIEQAKDCIKLYSRRWLIERFHFTLKSGCRIERLQLEKAQRLKNAIATYSIVAWRLLWLMHESRENPDDPCDIVFETDEWHALYVYVNKTHKLPKQQPTISQVVLWIAKLGGFLGRKKDGNPGIKTLWRGIRRLDDITKTYSIVKELKP